MRGSRAASSRSWPISGSIPAGAGEPRAGQRSGRSAGVYPRRCGGAEPPTRVWPPPPGLSPQVRGSLDELDRGSGEPGSIPAGAGEPRAGQRSGRSAGVYPRRCGGAEPPTRVWPPPPGLSPQVRGSLDELDRGSGEPGSIPAGAGEPSKPFDRSIGSGVYPRRCGGACVTPAGQTPPAGLSPQVRGSRHQTPPPLSTPGSIPAGAGEP